jgi:TfoX/Sxy family transcriptional regulator of competence genes
MAYSEELAQRIRSHIGDNGNVVEKKMFGGVAFMNHGNMAVGVSNDELMVRVGLDGYAKAIAEPGVRDFDLTGKRMKGWVLVDAQTTSNDPDLQDWIDLGLDFAASLPHK